ncbi:MAG: lycopene beta-cyclase [Pseudohongiellaceae bacterium]|jgi:lycopene beta-cyclase
MLTNPTYDKDMLFDLVIIGGGCAGLSLVRALCQQAVLPEHVPTTLIIEPRSHYIDDRSWCFWEHEKNVDDTLVAKSWPAWEFSTREKRRRHTSTEGWHYHYVPSIRFYTHAEKLIAQHSNMTLNRGEHVVEVIPNSKYLQVKTSSGSFKTRLLVDTRIPQSIDVDAATLKQVFYGVEVEFEHDLLQDDAALIMNNMRTDEKGFIFDYVLPLSPKSGLFEVTRFANDMIQPESLRAAACELVNRHGQQNGFKILREESGMIPMGLPTLPESGDFRWIHAGIGAGSARASTGYAFQRIQRWAVSCAHAVLNKRELKSPEVDRAYIAWMDNTLLRTLRDHPELGPDLFFALANGVSPDRLLRFLTDQPRSADLLAVIASLPKMPLIRSAVGSAFTRTSSRRGGDKWREA